MPFPQFSFIHISDLHFDREFVSSEVFRHEIKKKIVEDDLNADCLIISGDLFNRGNLNQEEEERYKEFLADFPGRDYTVVVPGNHDLNRSAQKKKDGSYNIFRTRKDLVLEKGNEAYNHGQFILNDDEKEILYNGAYADFFAFSSLMEFQSFNQSDLKLKETCYEVQEVQFSKSNFPCLIKFVLLNTGLIAGQSVSGDEYRKRILCLRKELDKATEAGDYVKAAEIQVRIAKQQKRYEDKGEMIIDEEDYNENGPGRLSLSRDGLRALSGIQAPDNILTIFVGHHGYQFLSAETKKALVKAMKNCKSGIYLCGHSHQSKYKRIEIGASTEPKVIEQIQAGVLYKDKGNDTQYGFDHGVFNVENNSIRCSITSYFLVESASGERRWLSEEIHISLDGIKPSSSTESSTNLQSQDQSEANENKITLDDKPSNPELKKSSAQEFVVPLTSSNMERNATQPPANGPAPFQHTRSLLFKNLNNNIKQTEAEKETPESEEQHV